jgi:membrane protease YdiL (CAAX protease family)
MRHSSGRTISWVGYALLAVILTLAVGGVWAALLGVNLATTPALPWAVVAMAPILSLLWRYAGGAGWPRRTAATRHRNRRAHPVPLPVFAWALLAGALSIIALIGLWIVFSQVVTMPGNPLPDFSRYPRLTVALVLVTASLVAALAEEVGIRGYVQSGLERRFSPPVAIMIAAMAIAPGHGLTQGFAWTTLLFYFLVDVTFGVSAHLTDSILPGMVVHGVGILIFFALIWPHDATRRSVREGGADGWFWIHVAQAIIFALLAVVAFARLAKVTGGLRADRARARSSERGRSA